MKNMIETSKSLLIVNSVVVSVLIAICIGKLINERTQQNIIITELADKAGISYSVKTNSNMLLKVMHVDPIIHVKK